MPNDLTVTLTADDLRIPAELIDAVAKRAWIIGMTGTLATHEEASITWEAHRAANSQSFLSTTHNILTTLTALHVLTHLDFEALPFWTICCRCKTDRDVVVIPMGSLCRLTPICPACRELIRAEYVAYQKECDEAEALERLKPRYRWFDPRGWGSHG
jgi:hypothetical protein